MGNEWFRQFLFPLRKSVFIRPKKIIAFDTEDNGSGPPGNFLCASFYDGEDAFTFTKRDDAREFLFRKRKYPVTFFAHHLEYDLMNLDYPEGTATLIPLKSRLIGAEYKYGNNNKVQFMDTGNFFVGKSIKELGSMLGFPKIEFEINRIKGKQPSEIPVPTWAEMVEYCERDAKICWLTANKLQELASKNNTRLNSFTAPSLAMRIFRTNYMGDKWRKRSMEINDFERLGYYGGRTEVFDYNLQPHIFYEDIKSSYPTAMKYKVYPVPSSWSIVRYQDWNDVMNIEGISLVTVQVPNMHIPPLPYRRGDDGKLIFPVGTWTAAYTHPELRMAIKYGVKILKVHESILYGKTFKPFVEYIDYFYKMKDETEGIERDFYKLMLNGLYGKFGEKRERTIKGHIDSIQFCHCPVKQLPDRKNTCPECRLVQIEGLTIIPGDRGWVSMSGGRDDDPKHAFPVIVAYVCAYGRIKLYEERLAYDKAVYCDTDSHLSIEPVNDNIGDALGQWERKEYLDFQPIAPKFYSMKNADGSPFALKLKGVKKNHTVIYQCPNPKCFYKFPLEYDSPHWCCGRMLDENDRRYCFERPRKTSEAIRQHKRPNQWHMVKKKISFFDDKRLKNPDGTSEPIVVNETFRHWTFRSFLQNNYKDIHFEPLPETASFIKDTIQQ